MKRETLSQANDIKDSIHKYKKVEELLKGKCQIIMQSDGVIYFKDSRRDTQCYHWEDFTEMIRKKLLTNASYSRRKLEKQLEKL